ncbi:NADH-quinone oxidoreductase subunit C [Streptomyces poriferorum]|uniref:NADH-quinone oxidoreductase subunit C n=1 Tax=Streptomyces poriferorum TaxID=2798799 RepID=A0ABY9IP01_9ACTN|nr:MULTISPECIES: NADH-quinone oxidoreductase subunit C [unclassified Streptomyces]MDP5313997.1 NADH-quinone oxidoreductase subunit C [Streptomyces sp. Alt4]WLQ57063.1 NADH-quinone oxidoreductase subunit C [Streptomyces sp. Alt2]
MTAAESYGRLPDAVTEIFGEDATAEQAHELLTVDVPPASWTTALESARDRLGCTYFDWLSAVDEPGTGFRVCAHVAALPDAGGGSVRRLLVRTTVPHEAAVLPTAIGVYAGADWHERETHEMFGIGFDGHPHLVPLLLPEGFEGHPLRKDFVLAARVAKAWPGAKEPGESEHGGPKRRTMLPPGVPDPNEWGPLKGQLPPAPARPARATGDRPPRRTRSASDATPAAPATDPAPPRRNRSASQGSAGQQVPAPPEAPKDTASAPATPAPPAATPAAPWHDARPAFDAPSGGSGDAGGSGEPGESRGSKEPGESRGSAAPGESDAPGESQPLRRLRSGGPGAEPPVREGAGRGEAPRSGTPAVQPTPDTPTAPPPEPPTERPLKAPEDQGPPNTPAGGDPE